MRVAPAVRVFLTLLGVILVIGAFVFTLIFGMATNPPPLRIAVAVQDLPAGSRLQPSNYRIVDQQIDPGLARLYVQERDLADYDGALVVDAIRRGDPLNKSRLAAGDRSAALRRYALVLTDSNEVIMTLPVNPAIIPDKVSAGDHVNILFTVGRDISLSNFPDPTEAPPTETPEPTLTPEPVNPNALETPVIVTPEITATATPTATPTPVVALPLADLMLEHV
ncbi:MAG: SAF domain-containing protein, partial [Aggregatilineales bacterium]